MRHSWRTQFRARSLNQRVRILSFSQTGSCQTEVYGALAALVDAMPAGYCGDPEAFSSLVDGLCDPSGQ